MTIEKLPSGSYRIKQMFEGKLYSATIPYKPTQKEAIALMNEKLQGVQGKHERMTFKQAAAKYVSEKENVLSPRTVREYGLYPDRLPVWFTTMPVQQITAADVQLVVNELCVTKAPKTVRSLHAFISSILGRFNPSMQINTTLPQNRRNEPNIPADADVKHILEYTKENNAMFYVPLVLACYSCRRSEICAATIDDLSGNVLTINKALVEDKDGKWVVKTTKTTDSTREIILPDDVADIIRAQGYVYNGAPQSISNYLARVQKQLGIAPFSIHKLRHYFASKCMDMGIDQKTIQEMGGWRGQETLTRIYQHSMLMKDETRRKSVSARIASSIL